MMSEQPLASPSTARLTWRPVLSVWQRFMCEWLVIGCLGVAIVSTSEGVMTGVQARNKNLGGELLCYVW